MQLIFKTAIASLAIVALTGVAGAACFEGHASHVTADASKEATIMSTHDDSLRPPQPATESVEAAETQPVTAPAKAAE